MEKTLESPLDCQIKSILKEINPEYSLEETLIKIEDRRRSGWTEDEMVGWHHQLNAHEFEQAPGDGEGQGSLACCSPWGHRESEMT